MSPEQKHRLDQLRKDLLEQAQRPGPLIPQVLEEEDRQPGERRSRPHRHPLPVSLETETVTLEPETICPQCGRAQNRIGEEVTEELDWVPAKLIRRRIVRPKYACRCSESSVAIAPLPPRLIPQSKLGLGLAVYIVLTRLMII